MNYSSFGCIIRSLQLWNINNMTTHACGRDKAAALKVNLIAINIRPLRLLSTPVLPCRNGAVECPVQVGRHDLAVVLGLAIQCCTLSPGNTRVGDEDVQTSVKLVNNFVD